MKPIHDILAQLESNAATANPAAFAAIVREITEDLKAVQAKLRKKK